MSGSDSAAGRVERSAYRDHGFDTTATPPTQPAPIIGLTTYLAQSKTGVWDVPASFLPAVYFEAINRAGGIAVLLPPQPVNDAIANRVLDGLDGIIITGGKDVEPARYGQDRLATTDEPQPVRDEWEESLLTAAIARNIPFLGICRGMQVLNVATGGTLVQHLPDVVGSERYNIGDGNFAVNAATLEEDGIVPKLLQETPTIDVKSYHHQAVDRLGEGLVVTARTDDGTIYAVEVPGVDFGIAVQWHPEEDAEEDIRLFAGLVDAAREYRKVNA